jgi:hypothetical protein
MAGVADGSFVAPPMAGEKKRANRVKKTRIRMEKLGDLA